MRGSSSVRLIGLLSRISGGSGRFCTDGFDGVESSRVKVFDRHLKRRQRDRAAWLTRRKDPLIDAVAENLLDRLEDCKRTFPTALCLGGSLGAVRRLLRGRGAIEKLIMMGASLDMVELCRNAEPDISDDKIETSFMVADEEFLPVKEGSLDLMISCLGLHWTNDLPGAMIQCRLALKPDGLFLEAILGGETLKELRIACTIAQMEREGDISPRLSPLAQVRDVGTLLTRACFALPGVDDDEYCVRYGSALELIEHLRQWVKPMLLHSGIDFKERYSFSNCCSVSVNVWSRGWNCSCNISGDLHDRVEKVLFPAESQKEGFGNRIFQGHPEAIWS